MIVYRLFSTNGGYDYIVVANMGPYYCVDTYWRFETLGM